MEEPTRDDAVAILRGLKDRYELFHGIRISDDALVAAVDFSIRYIGDRKLPDKAIDLLDEATSSVKMRSYSRPIELDKIEKEIRSLEIEREAIKEEKDKKTRLSEIEEEITLKKSSQEEFLKDWTASKKNRDRIKFLQNEILELEKQAEELTYSGEYAKVAEIRYGKIPEKKKELDLIE